MEKNDNVTGIYTQRCEIHITGGPTGTHVVGWEENPVDQHIKIEFGNEEQYEQQNEDDYYPIRYSGNGGERGVLRKIIEKGERKSK